MGEQAHEQTPTKHQRRSNEFQQKDDREKHPEQIHQGEEKETLRADRNTTHENEQQQSTEGKKAKEEHPRNNLKPTIRDSR